MQYLNGSTSRDLCAKPTLFCFSHLRWNWVFQRPQHLMSRAARKMNVLFFEEPVESDKSGVSLFVPCDGVTVITPQFKAGSPHSDVTAAQRRYVDAFRSLAAGAPRIAWYYTPEALTYTADFRFDLTIYDCMDELSHFKGAHTGLPDFERGLLSISDIVFTGGRSLQAAKSQRHGNVHCFPSSVDVAHFASSKMSASKEPAEQKAIAGPKIGYCAVFDERLDIGLVDRLAALRPDWNFIMIGPVVKIDPASLPRRENIHWLGQRSYAELPLYFAGWDAAFMPFALNAATKFISPTKTPEFLAAGLPVVSTAVRDVVTDYGSKGLVEIVSSAEEACERLEVVMHRKSQAWESAVAAALARQSWDETYRQIDALMQKTLFTRASSSTVRPAAGAGHA